MKKIFYLFTFLFYHNISYGQDNFLVKFPNFNECHNNIEKVIEISNGDLLATINTFDCSVPEEEKSELVIVNAKGKIKKRIPFRVDQNQVLVGDILSHQLGFIIIGKCKINQKINLALYIINEDLQVLKSLKIEQPENCSNIKAFKMYYEGSEKLYFGYNQIFDDGSEPNPVVGFVGNDLKYIKINDFLENSEPYELTEVTKGINSKGYIVDNFYRSLLLDDSLKLIKSMQYTGNNLWLENRKTYKNNFIVNGQHREDFTNINLKRDIAVQIINADNEVIKSVTIGKLLGVKDTYDLPYPRGLSFTNKNKIFIGGITYRDFSFGKVNDSWALVSRLDTNLQVKWTRYFWGEGSNVVWGVLATKDEGVLVYGYRDTLKTGVPDNVFIMKLNADGLLSNKENTQFPDIQVFTGPNPFRSTCTFALNRKESEEIVWLEIYNSLGQIMKKTTLQDGLNSIDFNSFSIGTYPYNVLINNQLVTKGKLVKIE